MSHFYWIAEEMTGDEEGDREGEWQANKAPVRFPQHFFIYNSKSTIKVKKQKKTFF